MATTLLACPDCGTVQLLPKLRGRGRLICCRCASTLERSTGRGIDTTLALSLATLLMLFPANLMTLFSVSFAGIERGSRLGSGIIAMWAEGWPVMAVILGLQGIVLPFIRFGLLSAVLAALRFGRHGRWTGPAFRWSQTLDAWAMPDVFLIGAAVGYGRVAAKIPLQIGPGGWSLITAAALAMLTRAEIDRRAIWRMIPAADHVDDSRRFACVACDLVIPESLIGRRCPRCRAKLFRRRPASLLRTAALVTAGFLFYPVANWFPMSTDVRLGHANPHTIASGVERLLSAGFWPLAAVIFTASIAIPLVKLGGLTWLIWSTRHGSERHLLFKTRAYRFIEEVGRWQNIDVFTIAIFLPLMQFGSLASVHAAKGAPAFLSVAVLTMLAARLFDPRLMWDRVRP
jgi:paraquat-inducible protein A